MAGKTEIAPLTDAALAELKVLHAAAPARPWLAGKNKASGRVQVHNGQHQVCAIWNTTAHPATDTAKYIATLHNAFPHILARLEAAERERDAYKRQCDSLIEPIVAEGQRQVDRDAHMKKLGAIEAYDEMRKQAVEVGKESGLAAKFCKLFAEQCIEAAAQLRREGE